MGLEDGRALPGAGLFRIRRTGRMAPLSVPAPHRTALSALRSDPRPLRDRPRPIPPGRRAARRQPRNLRAVRRRLPRQPRPLVRPAAAAVRALASQGLHRLVRLALGVLGLAASVADHLMGRWRRGTSGKSRLRAVMPLHLGRKRESALPIPPRPRLCVLLGFCRAGTGPVP